MLIGLAAIVALFTLLWLASLAVRNSSIVDMWWGPGILLIGLTYWLANGGAQSRSRMVLSLLTIWAIRAGPDEIRAFVGEGPILTDDKPVIEYFLSLPKGDRPGAYSGRQGSFEAILRP